MRLRKQATLLALAPLLTAALLACEVNLLGPQMKCYYDDTGQFLIEIQCATQRPSGSWKLCGETETVDDCEAWLRQQGIAS